MQINNSLTQTWFTWLATAPKFRIEPRLLDDRELEEAAAKKKDDDNRDTAGEGGGEQDLCAKYGAHGGE